jgi:hypothetical protein
MKILFEVRTPLNVTIRITEEYWRYIVEIKHKIMANKEHLVKEILAEPDEVRRSLIDKSVFLYYKKFDRLYCVVTKHLNDEGFIITAYPTDKIKEGEIVWTK